MRWVVQDPVGDKAVPSVPSTIGEKDMNDATTGEQSQVFTRFTCHIIACNHISNKTLGPRCKVSLPGAEAQFVPHPVVLQVC